ncbi:aspartic peptidase domain-containing protein [Suillus spraguei]|nr:aspartic peptidase domain-containing protein [Suillus spraguei]
MCDLLGRPPVHLRLYTRVQTSSFVYREIDEASRHRATNSYGSKNIVAADRVRIQNLQAQDGSSSSVNIANAATSFTADIGVGSPATYYTLLLDTGSSNTWIGAKKPYQPTTTSQDTGGTFNVGYGDIKRPNYASGKEYTDTVTLNSNLVIPSQSIGVSSSNFDLGDGLDGLLGLGPGDLTHGTVSNADKVPTVMDNLFEQGSISSEVLGVFFAPASSDNDNAGGELAFGGCDDSKYTGSINYVPITSTSPASTYWGIDQSISYGQTQILSQTAGIVDTGSTLILIATDAFEKYQSATGGTLDKSTGLLKISSDQYSQLSSLYFAIGGVTYELTSNAQIWPRSLNTAINGAAGGIYLVISDLGSRSGAGLDFVNGYCFLERFYSVYDTTNSRVGFATTAYTSATTN